MNVWSKIAVRAASHVVGLIVATSLVVPLFGLDRTWTGGDGTWTEGVTTGWNPADEPDTDDTAIFNTSNAVSLGSANTVMGLTLSGGNDLFANNFDLTVSGVVQLSGSSTNLIVGGADSQLTTRDVIINNAANLQIDGGAMQIDDPAGTGLLDINAGGELLGHGTVSMTDAVGAGTTLIINDGFITAQRSPAVIFGDPLVGALTIGATDADARIDLDGAAEGGAVIVRRNQTLDVNIPLADIFDGSMDMFQDSTLDMSSAWTLGAGATLDIDNGFVDGTFPIPDAPAGTSTIAGAALTQSGGTISVVDSDGTLVFSAPFTMNGGTFDNEGHVIFNANATINAGGTFNMGPLGSDLTVAANAVVAINQNSFNLDGNAAGTVITVNENAILNLNLGDYDNDSATNGFDGVIVLNSGDFTVTTGDAEFVLDGVLTMNNTADSNPSWNGEPVDVGNDSGLLDADINVIGSGSSDFGTSVDFNSDADVNIAAGARLRFLSNSNVDFNTVNGGNNAEFTGAGTIEFNGTVNVNESVTLNMAGGTVDLDGNDAIGNFVNIDAPMTIHAATFDSFGRNNGVGTNTLDINNSVGTGVLTVNLDNPDDEWTLNVLGVMNLVNDNTEATLLAGSDVNINGTVNVTGDVRTTARLDIGSTAVINVNTAGQPLRLAGGSGVDVNTISGGTITGVGRIGADTGKELRGFGTINADIEFAGSANLRASGGTLTLGGDFISVNILGTADDTGVLNVANPWFSEGGPGGVIGAVVLNGGTLQGATITNDNSVGIQGHGTITARVINTSKLVAANGGTLLLQTSGNDNDWDGAGNTGELHALSADLVMVDTSLIPPVKDFGGRVRVINDQQVFANGFGMRFLPGSIIELEGAGKLRATASTDIRGTLNVDTGADATIQVSNNSFLQFETGSATTLDGDLTLLNNNIIIEDGAAFSGGGALIIPDGSHMVAENQADIGVLLDMQGAFRPGNSQGIGRVELFDMQMASTSELFVELIGTSLNAFDRLVASGDVIVDGFLSLDIDDISPGVPFVPELGNTFNIITGNTVTGTFDTVDVSGMPDGLAFHVAYLPNAVQLQVVTEPAFDADFDDDGDVDGTDLAIWRNAYDLNQLGDADGDNDSDGRDFLIWQREFGSAPLSALSASTAVPEPGSLAPLAAITVILSLFRNGSSGPSTPHGW